MRNADRLRAVAFPPEDSSVLTKATKSASLVASRLCTVIALQSHINDVKWQDEQDLRLMAS